MTPQIMNETQHPESVLLLATCPLCEARFSSRGKPQGFAWPQAVHDLVDHCRTAHPQSFALVSHPSPSDLSRHMAMACPVYPCSHVCAESLVYYGLGASASTLQEIESAERRQLTAAILHHIDEAHAPLFTTLQEVMHDL